MSEATGPEASAAELRAAREEIAQLKAELDECRKGVTEAYDELERTNQGVVALYAEIDDKNLQLQEATAAKTRFLRSISHELRTPVNSILGLTALLLDPRQPERLSAEQTEQVEFVRTSAADLLRLVEELMDLAKAESGRLVPVPREVSLPDLVGELHGMVEPLLRPGVRLEVRTSGGEQVRTDADLLRHVLRNLLSNAAKFTADGAITVSVTVSAPERFQVEVADTGVGIAPDDLPRIFEEFYQALSPLQAGVRGTGLGLSFAQIVARALGGEITVHSEPGVGSSFLLTVQADVPKPAEGDGDA